MKKKIKKIRKMIEKNEFNKYIYFMLIIESKYKIYNNYGKKSILEGIIADKIFKDISYNDLKDMPVNVIFEHLIPKINLYFNEISYNYISMQEFAAYLKKELQG